MLRTAIQRRFPSRIPYKRINVPVLVSPANSFSTRALQRNEPLPINRKAKVIPFENIYQNHGPHSKENTSLLGGPPVNEKGSRKPREKDILTDSDASPASMTYTGNTEIPITSKLHIIGPEEDTPRGIWPVYRLMVSNLEKRRFGCQRFELSCQHILSHTHFNQDESGIFRDSPPSLGASLVAFQPLQNDLSSLSQKLAELYPHHRDELLLSTLLQTAKHPYTDTNNTHTLLRAHRHIVRLRQMDDILLNAQRQGRISFYMSCRGEEAIHIGAASALDNGDPLLTQYREQGFIMWRGFSLDQFMNQCFSTDADLGKGRQMPVHYGSRALNFHTVSSPLGTQLPQAVGVAYRLKLQKQPNVSVCVFGDGCASTTDFHSALNFAATLQVPCIFLCRNNGYAISTPVTDQYAGDGIVSRAPGYGMAGIRVDGNDIFAVHSAVREAKKYAIKHNRPVLIEAMTYRQGHHSTSDDSSRYRSQDEVRAFADHHDPLKRLENFLDLHHVQSQEDSVKLKDSEKISVLEAMGKAEKRKKPDIGSMFEDVYHEKPLSLIRQEEELRNHISKYPRAYK